MLTPDLNQKFKSVDYTQFFPAGRIGKMSAAAYRKLMSPESIQAGARAFERDVRIYEMQEAKRMAQMRALRREMAAKLKAQQQFKKIWPDGATEQLLKFGTFNPLRKIKK